MSCKPVCKLCNRLVISQAVTFSGGNLIINIPAGAYNDGEKYHHNFNIKSPYKEVFK